MKNRAVKMARVHVLEKIFTADWRLVGKQLDGEIAHGSLEFNHVHLDFSYKENCASVTRS